MKKLLVTVALLATMSGAGWARTIEEQVLSSLEAQGYIILEQGYTFLGRLRIVAENGQIHREIVVNPGTGEILRDYAVTLPANPTMLNPPSGSSSGSSNAVASKPKPSSGGNKGGGSSSTSVASAGTPRDDATMSVTGTTHTTPSLGTASSLNTTSGSSDPSTEMVLPDPIIQVAPGEP